jgi:hypothetical protein
VHHVEVRSIPDEVVAEIASPRNLRKSKEESAPIISICPRVSDCSFTYGCVRRISSLREMARNAEAGLKRFYEPNRGMVQYLERLVRLYLAGGAKSNRLFEEAISSVELLRIPALQARGEIFELTGYDANWVQINKVVSQFADVYRELSELVGIAQEHGMDGMQISFQRGSLPFQL